LVMATGSGKTRTTMSLIDIFLRTNQAKQTLFVADRDALVKQAIKDGFMKFLPDQACERIFTHTINKTSSLYAVTLQTLNLCFQSFTPSFFDLIIFDEAHRSIFNKWNEVFQYFDARIIGLTATPADFIDRSTFLTFDCEDNIPTSLYPYKQAVDEGYLVDYNLYQAKTKFQRNGIKGVDLDEEERNALNEQGIDPDDLEFEGTELERKVSNKDTIRKQWQEIWDTCHTDQSGQLPGKTIVFAMTEQHALRLLEVFEEMFPQFPNMTRVITHKSDHKGSLIEQFKTEDQPRIAITVDLLETGIDVPEVVNLVFMRPIQSRIKLEQMIGRGTRCHEACNYPDRLPNGHKKDFLIIDFWENDFNKPANEELTQSLPVLVTLFNTRLKLLEQHLGSQHSAQKEKIVQNLREQIAQIPLDSFSVKKSSSDLEEVMQDAFWRYSTSEKLEFLKRKIAPLLRYAPGVDVQATTFKSKVERLKLHILTDKETSTTSQSIAEDVSRLPNFVLEDPQCKTAADLCLSDQLDTASPDELDQVIDTLAIQMKNRREKVNTFLMLDLPDLIETRGYIFLKGGSERVYITHYRQRVEEHIWDMLGTHPTIAAIDRGEKVSDQQLIELERTLHRDLGEGDIELSTENIRKAYKKKVGSLIEFLRDLLELDGIPDYNEIVQRQFQEHIAKHHYNADQLKFLSMVQNVFLQRHCLQLADLYDSPFTSLGVDAVERLFTSEQIHEIVHFANTLAA
jgi:type I restriction enzyme R subunit